jgi:thioredoxin reductase
MLDVIVVGAGPAGLSAALVLGRCRRRVLVIDAGRPRNAGSRALHGFLTRDGIDPQELLRLGREQLRPYETVTLQHGEVRSARTLDEHFELSLDDGVPLRTRKLILATGVIDELPTLPDLERYYGRGVFHCPYCDGWEQRAQPLVAYGRGSTALQLALELTVWSDHVVLCSNGPAELDDDQRKRLSGHGIPVHEESIESLGGNDGTLDHVRLAGNRRLLCRGLFFTPRWRQHSALPEQLGCRLTAKGAVETGAHECTNVPGLYVAGDASAEGVFAIGAAAEGAQAAVAVNMALLKEDVARKEARPAPRASV